jgi:hypothetical protein
MRRSVTRASWSGESGSHMHEIVKWVDRFTVQIGGEPHTGWLPQGSAIPLPTPVRRLSMNIAIEFDGIGYLLCFSSADGTYSGDTWHETLASAELAAKEDFGVEQSDWRSV